ncbi:Uncharacterised protein [uncultured archaeon]|nr:Uncharacterised protein [uncultured archaeon]
MAYLYVNAKGRPWRKHSYSAGNVFDQSPMKYYYQKVLGWKEFDNKASFFFGRALEESIQFHHEHGGQGAVEDFKRRWAAHKDRENVRYTDKEKNWATCLQMGQEMLKLYIVVQPSLPIPLGGGAVFQREYSKEVFPNDPNYGGIEDAGKLDIIAYADANHERLAKVDIRQFTGGIRPVIIDIKTGQVDFPEQQGMAAFDGQLRRYSWLSGIRDVAFLWFKKSGLGYKKGYSATVIETVGSFQAGQECVIARVDENHAWIVYNDFMVEEMERAQGKKGNKLDTTNAAEERVMNWLHQRGTYTPLDRLTRQRLQFNAGYVTPKSAEDAGTNAARQIVSIVNAWNTKSWPNNFGVRYPRDDRNDAYFRAFVLGDETYKQQNFTKSDEDAFDDLFREDDEQ